MSSPDPVLDALLALLEGQATQGRQLTRIARKLGDIMALTTKEQEAIDALRTDFDAALAALKTSTQGLKDQVAALIVLRDQLQATNTADEAQLATLSASIVALQGTLDSQESEVVDALVGLDQHVKILGGV